MKRLKTINGMKILNRWSGALLFSILFLLLGVGALLAGMYLIPLVKFNNGLASYDVYAIDFVLAMFNHDLPKELLNHDGFQVWRNNLFGLMDNTMQGLSHIVYFALGVCSCLVVLVAVFAVLMFIIYLISGRLLSFKSPLVWSWLLFVFSLFLNGLVVGLIFLLGFICQSQNSSLVFRFEDADLLFNYIYAGGTLFVAILNSIIYALGIKNRLYIKYALRIMDAQNARKAQAANMYHNPYAPNAAPYGQAQVAPVGLPIYVSSEPKAQIEPPVASNQNTLKPTQITEVRYVPSKGLPPELSSIGGHAFSQNSNLEVAVIPMGIKEIGASAFSNCPNLKVVSIPVSVNKIGYNAFFGCRKLARINYGGKKVDWKHISRGSNWLASSGTTTVVCVDGAITVNPYH